MIHPTTVEMVYVDNDARVSDQPCICASLCMLFTGFYVFSHIQRNINTLVNLRCYVHIHARHGTAGVFVCTARSSAHAIQCTVGMSFVSQLSRNELCTRSPYKMYSHLIKELTTLHTKQLCLISNAQYLCKLVYLFESKSITYGFTIFVLILGKINRVKIG